MWHIKKDTNSVISTSQAKSATEPVVLSVITYSINRQATASNSEEIWIIKYHTLKKKENKRTSHNSLPFPYDDFLPLLS